MKKSLILVVLACLSISIQAQKVICLQNGPKTIFHNNLDTIMTKAVAGDTIYLPGLNYNYGKDFIIDKELHIFGVGYNIDSTQATGYTGLQNNVIFVSGSDNSSISGIWIQGSITFGTNATNNTVSHVSISRCLVNDLSLGYNFNGNSSNASFISIRENIIRATLDGGSTCSNVSVENNFISHAGRNFVNQTNTYFSNNVFDHHYRYDSQTAFINVSNVYYTNNIIRAENPLIASQVNNCTFTNNIFYANVTFDAGVNGTNTGLGNIVNQSVASIFEGPVFNVYHDGNWNSHWDKSYNYRLKATSPGKNAGTDGTDIGMYGGLKPYKVTPLIPRVTAKTIAPKVVNGKLGVSVNVEAQAR